MTLTVIAGGMFAEKTTELQRRGRRLKRAGKRVAYFKPAMDTRYSENEIVTHDGAKVEAININENAPLQLTSREYFENYDVFLIDEVQFFHSFIMTAIETLLREGKTVIVAGLDLDFKGHPFFKMGALMLMAENVVKLHAVCSECGDDAWVSHKENNGQRIQLGTDEYTPMCRKCFNNLKKKGTVNNG
ncbi:thymidine kinase [Bacillus toyonensis]|uniref:thymidine kinase n=1 Tax=Bacillus toyonensis TaxID=155322 RepID=UPI003D301E69